MKNLLKRKKLSWKVRRRRRLERRKRWLKVIIKRRFMRKLNNRYSRVKTFLYFYIFFSRLLIMGTLLINLNPSPFLIFMYKTKLHKFYKKKFFYCFIKKKLNNLFLTITNRRGDVLITLSAGNVKIKSKKKKRSPVTLNQILKRSASFLISKNIFLLDTLFVLSNHKFLLRNTILTFKQLGIKIKKINHSVSRPHSILYRKKKMRRI